MGNVNLFHYATSELSQDAFICWLLAHGMEEHQAEEPLLYRCAMDFLHQVPGLGHATKVDDIRKQYKNIDALVIVDDIHVIIEDKTYTKLHGNQIDKYTKTLVKEGVPKDKIRTVFYKIIEQSKKEHVDCEFTRPRILCLLRKYKSCNNAIFTSYLDHLEELEARTQAYHQKTIDKWDGDAVRGFFADLQARKEKEYGIVGWGYVSNPAGGFMGMWFHWLTDEKVLRAMGIYEYIESIYLQFEHSFYRIPREENYILAVKVEAEDAHKKEASKIRRDLYEAFKEEIPAFKKKDFRAGKYMTVGYVLYDEKNYGEKVELLQKALERIVQKWSDHRPSHTRTNQDRYPWLNSAATHR